MAEATCSVCDGPPKRVIGHDLPPMTTSSTGFCLCGACAVSSLFPAAQASGTAHPVAAELEKLMGPAPSTAAAEANAAPVAPQQHVTEAEIIAAIADLAGQRPTATRESAAKKPKSAAPAISDEADRLIAAMQPRARHRPTEEEVAAELEKLMGSPTAA